MAERFLRASAAKATAIDKALQDLPKMQWQLKLVLVRLKNLEYRDGEVMLKRFSFLMEKLFEENKKLREEKRE